jgi:SAM-dependent methyltransferase
MGANEQQVKAWNGGESVHYVDHADRYDRQLEPFALALLERAGLGPRHTLLDIGCGCGATTLQAARRVERAVGLDLSEPLIDVARRRAEAAFLPNVEFVIADAQTFDPLTAGFDRIISQFGLMFFDDPVRALANIRQALAPGGTVTFVCWQGLDANEWLTVVARAVGERAPLPDLGGLDGGPGMFSLRHPGEIAELLSSAGFSKPRCESLTPSIVLGGGGTIEESMDFLFGMGMVKGLLGLAPSSASDAIRSEVRAALELHLEPGVGVRVGAAAWLVAAQS